jgi:hypothetical protein
MNLAFAKLSLAAALVMLPSAPVVGQSSCPTNTYFAWQVASPAKLLADSTARFAVKFSQASADRANVVQFVVDSSGKPSLPTMRALALSDTNLFAALVHTLSGWRFIPATLDNGCHVKQLLQGSISWDAGHGGRRSKS